MRTVRNSEGMKSSVIFRESYLSQDSSLFCNHIRCLFRVVFCVDNGRESQLKHQIIWFLNSHAFPISLLAVCCSLISTSNLDLFPMLWELLIAYEC